MTELKFSISEKKLFKKIVYVFKNTFIEFLWFSCSCDCLRNVLIQTLFAGLDCSVNCFVYCCLCVCFRQNLPMKHVVWYFSVRHFWLGPSMCVSLIIAFSIVWIKGLETQLVLWKLLEHLKESTTCQKRNTLIESGPRLIVLALILV